jgi:hypothetical protein
MVKIFTGNVPGNAASNADTWVFGSSPTLLAKDSTLVNETYRMEDAENKHTRKQFSTRLDLGVGFNSDYDLPSWPSFVFPVCTDVVKQATNLQRCRFAFGQTTQHRPKRS